MQLTDRVHLVGSGAYGFGLTDPYDCHIYLIDGGIELALIDVGAGMGAAQVVENIRSDGFDPDLVRQILCTHAHGDHAGGAARMQALLPNAAVSMSREAADYIRIGDESGTSISTAKTAGIYPADYHARAVPRRTRLRGGGQGRGR